MFKTVIKKLTDLPWEDVRNLFTWPSKSPINAENPHLLVAKATNQSGEVVVYVTAEPILLVDGFVFNPQSTKYDSRQAGDLIDSALAKQAGAQKIWIVVPDGVEKTIKGEKFIRVVERRVHQPVATAQRLGCCEVTQQAYLD